MKIILNLFFLIFLALVIEGCNHDDFSPLADLKQKTNYYCMLDTRILNQYVRAQSSYLSDDQRKVGSGIRIYLMENAGKTFQFRDTLIDSESKFSLFSLNSFKLKRNTTYRLAIYDDSVKQYADTYIPPETKMSFYMNVDTIETKGENVKMVVKYSCYISIPKNAPDLHMIHCFMKYEKKVNGIVESKVINVPVNAGVFSTESQWDLWDDKSKKISDYVGYFGDIPGESLSDGYTSRFYSSSGNDWKLNMPIGAWYWALSKIGEGAKPEDITIKGAFLVFYTVDRFYYENYGKLQNDYSLRFDEPVNLTNFKGNQKKPIGFFGAVTADSIVNLKVHHYVIDKLGYKIGQ
jgi:hypothetical protein